MAYKPGKYLARVVDCGLTKTKAGDAMVLVRFKWDEENTERELNWNGSLKDGRGREITMEALKVYGLKTKDLSLLVDGAENVFDTVKPVMITVELEAGTDGKDYAKIKWVNDPDRAGSFKNEITNKDEAKALLAKMNLGADLVDVVKPTKKKVVLDDGHPF
jgi:hypothetical protein